ncbi:MAG: adenine deaminase [Herpetosiphonaceae bacterium]|nr:adenine deaminase [Herpetosiphonaceae bacterium]
MTTVTELQDQIRAALGERPLDLLVSNVRLIDVYRECVVETDLGISGDRIVAVLPGAARAAKQVIDAGGRFAIPSFIDAHIHIESALLTPDRLAEVIVPTGTTTLLVDPMEVANVAGYEGLAEFFRSVPQLPYRIFVEVSSRVPTAPGLETTGGELGPAEVRRALDWPNTISLGELDPSKVLEYQAPYLEKVLDAHARGKIANGHAAGLAGRDLEAYATGRLADDHECVTLDDVRERLALGMTVIIREGSSERNLHDLISGIVREKLPTRHMLFCVDDKFSGDLAAEGHIDYNVNQAIRLGLDPIAAIQMATLNAAEHFRLDDRLGALVPGRLADFILSDSLDPIIPAQVYVGGQLVAENGHLVVDVAPLDYAPWLKDTVHLLRGDQAADYTCLATGGHARVRVIEIVPDQIINYFREAELAVQDGELWPDLTQDVLKIAVVERHGKNGNIKVAFAKGFGLQRGAIGSTVAHDHHNIVVVGTNDADLAACARTLAKMHGGFVAVAGGQVLAQLPLPVAGLMSDHPAVDVNADLDKLNAAARALGSSLNSPFMTLSFVSLPSIPEAGLTDMGLVDVRTHQFVSVLL